MPYLKINFDTDIWIQAMYKKHKGGQIQPPLPPNFPLLFKQLSLPSVSPLFSRPFWHAFVTVLFYVYDRWRHKFFLDKIYRTRFCRNQWNVCYTTTDINQKKKNDFRSKLSIFVRIFDPCDEIVKCLGLSTNMKICFRHNRCQYWGFEYVIICVVLNREMHRIEIICYIPWFPFKEMSWKDS